MGVTRVFNQERQLTGARGAFTGHLQGVSAAGCTPVATGAPAGLTPFRGKIKLVLSPLPPRTARGGVLDEGQEIVFAHDLDRLAAGSKLAGSALLAALS